MIRVLANWYRLGWSPYLKAGRLADVLAALQVMAAARRPDRNIKDWTGELSQSVHESELRRWKSVFDEHPEFFLVYEDGLKAALRCRYTNKLFDSKAGKEFTRAEKEALPLEEQYALTTRPLTTDASALLLRTAIELHTHAIQDQLARRWWIPIAAAILSFIGAIMGTFLGSHK